MADISRLSRLVTGVQRQVDLQSNALVVGSLKVGSATPTELTKAILDNLIALQNGTDFSDGTNSHTHDGRYYTETEMGSTANGEGASLVGIEDASAYFTGTNVEVALDELEAQIGGLTSSTFSFTEGNVLANNDALYAALDKLDLRWGDLGSTANGEGASIVAIEDAAGYFTGTNAEAAFDELRTQIGGTTSTTFDFSEANVLADNDAIYAALEKLDLKHGDYASTANGEGASLIGVEDSAGNFAGANVEAVLAELVTLIASSQAGINMKDAARVATTADLSATFNASGGANSLGQFTGTPTTVDGVSIATGDRILVKDQSSALENGIYVVTGTTTVWDRADDFDGNPGGEVKGGNLVFIQEGTASANTQYILEGNADDKTVNTDALNWKIFSRAEAIVDGDGLSKTGLTLSVDPATEVAGSRAAVYVGADGVGIDLDNTSLDHSSSVLQVKDLGISTGKLAATSVTAAKLGADVAGTGLTGGNGAAIDIDFASTFTIDGADAKAIEASKLASTTNGEGAAIIGIEDASGYWTGTDLETVLNEIEAQIGGTTSTTFAFTEDNVLADNDPIYAALDKLDLKWGDLASTANGEGASLVGIEDAAGNFTATNVEGALAELAAGVGSLTESLTAGEAFTAASAPYACRFGITAGAETEGRVYKADPTELSVGGADAFHVIGLANPGSDVSVAGSMDVVKAGPITVTAHGFTIGQPIYLDSNGALTSTAPSTTGEAAVKVGVAKDTNTIEVQIQVMGVN